MGKPKSTTIDQTDRDNRSRQLNPNNDAYWQSRGHEQRLPDWEHRRADPPSKPTTKTRREG
jgi:hypothetical protein